MSSSFFGAGGFGGGGGSSAFFFGMAYGPTLSVGPPAAAGTSCFGLPLSGVWEAGWVDCVPAGWSCETARTVPRMSVRQPAHTHRYARKCLENTEFAELNMVNSE